MPMGIISDEEFDKETKRSGFRSAEFDRSDISDANRIPRDLVSDDNVSDHKPPPTVDALDKEVSDYEPKESGLELRSMESSTGISQTEDSIFDQRAIIHQLEKGRPKGRNNRSAEERAIIAGEALMNGNQAAISKYSVSQSSVSAYKNGATSTSSYDKPDDELMKDVSRRRVQIAHVAHGKLSDALDQITHEKLVSANLSTIAKVAHSMSAIVKNMEPEQANLNQQNIQFTFYAPKQRSEDQFDVIDLQGEGYES